MTEEIKNPSNLDTEGVKQERIKISVDGNYTKPSNFGSYPLTKCSHIRVKRGWGIFSYYHHGIYVSDNEVYHLTGKYHPRDWKNAKPTLTSLDRFLKGGKVEVRKFSEKQNELKCDPETILENAKKLLPNGQKDSNFFNNGYNLLWNNCEGFANTCIFIKDLDSFIESLNSNDVTIWDKLKMIAMSEQAKNGLKITAITVFTIGGLIIKVLDSKNSDDSKEA